MITPRDITIAAVSVAATFAITAVSAPKPMGSVAIAWGDVPVQQEEVRAVRQFLRAPTATLDELELHVTTLPAGATSHAPHKHANEELVIIKEGEVEVLVDGQMKRVGPGSVVFNASNEMHSLRNIGAGPATYHVINWTSSATPSARKQ
ncbi:cupin domain-containing protein [Steroidobacter sp. S1-65]|uniref:Cupin domain-containing protein n=1 Tax=Steroidobacter gossypii TaxID=2805490 RepID=A0ABS1X0Z3_9GAMM|nr:cupin domain-containing protein [Steroidobacter gossypii]MBM0106901.1 cupin domain-containing protein [Steroidobacter gossypii]